MAKSTHDESANINSTEEFIEFRNPSDPAIQRLVRAIDLAYANPLYLMWRGFLYGLMAGIGGAIGTALIVVVSGYVFSRLGGIERIKGFFDQFISSLTSSQAANINNDNGLGLFRVNE